MYDIRTEGARVRLRGVGTPGPFPGGSASGGYRSRCCSSRWASCWWPRSRPSPEVEHPQQRPRVRRSRRGAGARCADAVQHLGPVLPQIAHPSSPIHVARDGLPCAVAASRIPRRSPRGALKASGKAMTPASTRLVPFDTGDAATARATATSSAATAVSMSRRAGTGRSSSSAASRTRISSVRARTGDSRWSSWVVPSGKMATTWPWCSSATTEPKVPALSPSPSTDRVDEPVEGVGHDQARSGGEVVEPDDLHRTKQPARDEAGDEGDEAVDASGHQEAVTWVGNRCSSSRKTSARRRSVRHRPC